MKLGIGIDTGGTYTDTVVYDFDNKTVLNSAKALTSKEDLSIGIGNALDKLPVELLNNAEVVSLSTTLATNACVENKGGRAKLLFIGVDHKVVRDVGHKYGLPAADEIYFLDSESSFDGEIIKWPDWDAFIDNSREWFKDAESVGIVEINATKTNALLEKKAKELISKNYGIPVICGHELFSELNSIQRGASTLLNARLIPIIENFLKAIRKSLHSRNINAPVVIVRSDGSLMSEEFTNFRPVETLLCGPAASVTGGVELSGEKNCLIIDMGGTTTDISIVKDGVPLKVTDGVNIGKWRTFVKGVYIDTFGLGGDSRVSFDKYKNMHIGPERVVPLSVVADKWPHVVDKLQELAAAKRSHTLPLHEFFSLVRDISDDPKYTEQEIAFCQALKEGPLIYTDAAGAAGVDKYNFNVKRLEKEGIIVRCGLTPTDIMHIKGDFSRFNKNAAEFGVKYVSTCLGVSKDALPDMIYDTVKKALYTNIVRILLEDSCPVFRKNGLGAGVETLISESWKAIRNGEKTGFLDFSFNTPAVLVGVGAPIHIFLPDVAKALETRFVVPENAGVANAVGALAGNITATCEIEAKPEYTAAGVTGYTVYGKTENRFAGKSEEAVELALAEAVKAARDEAVRRGAQGDITVTTEVIDSMSEAKDKTRVSLGIKVIATAVGRVTL